MIPFLIRTPGDSVIEYSGDTATGMASDSNGAEAKFTCLLCGWFSSTISNFVLYWAKLTVKRQY